MKIRQVIYGDYVATPIKNAFNNKTSYWLSKKDCTYALYMFTVGNGDTEKEFEERLSEEGFKEFIPRFEEHLRRPFNFAVYQEECKILESICELKEKLKEAMKDMNHQDISCDFIITQGRYQTFLKNTLLSDACTEAYKEAKYGNVKCYMAIDRKKAPNPVFSIINGVINYRGRIIELTI